MLRLSLLVILLTHRIRTAHVADTLTKRFDTIYEKLGQLNVTEPKLPTSRNKLYEKLDRLNALAPDSGDLSDEEEELLSTMQRIGRLSAEQMDRMMRDLQRVKVDGPEDEEYSDAGWEDEDPEGVIDYPMDGNDDWEDADASTAKPQVLGVTPSAFTRIDSVRPRPAPVSAAEYIAATNARPVILDGPPLTREERTIALNNMKTLIRYSKNLLPQPRWLTIKQMAPAADIVYMPPCVQLHRCAPDSGCCINEGEVVAPIDGKSVILPIYLHKADGNMNVVRMQFFNHTRCACVSRSTLQTTTMARIGSPSASEVRDEGQNDWRAPSEEPILATQEPTAPPQLRRCTCPALFLASMTDTEPCSCVCDWPDFGRRRDCQSLARGKEHFGLRDRVCVATGDCTPPSCEYGAYNRNYGQCPTRVPKYRRRYLRRKYPEKFGL